MLRRSGVRTSVPSEKMHRAGIEPATQCFTVRKVTNKPINSNDEQAKDTESVPSLR